MQDVLAEIDAFDDLHVVDRGHAFGDLAAHVAPVESDPVGQLLGCGVEFVEVVLPLIEVVADLLVRHGDRAAPAAVAVAVLCRGGELSGGIAEAAVHIDHRARQTGMRCDHFGDLLCVGLDPHLLVERDLTHLGDQAGVVL